MRRSFWLLLLTLFWSALAHSADHNADTSANNSADSSLDWNETGIAWLNYEEGIEIARKEGRPVLVVFYASWCHACHSYRNLFHDQDIEVLAKELVMIRVNVDSRPDLNAMFSGDGLYLPRSFGLSADGEPLAITSNNRHFRYFYAANDITGYGRMMQDVGSAGASQM